MSRLKADAVERRQDGQEGLGGRLAGAAGQQDERVGRGVAALGFDHGDVERDLAPGRVGGIFGHVELAAARVHLAGKARRAEQAGLQREGAGGRRGGGSGGVAAAGGSRRGATRRVSPSSKTTGRRERRAQNSRSVKAMKTVRRWQNQDEIEHRVHVLQREQGGGGRAPLGTLD